MKRLLISASVLTLAACGAQQTATETVTEPEAQPAAELLMPLPDQTTADITAEDLAIRIKTLADDTFEGHAELGRSWMKQCDTYGELHALPK